MLTVLDLFSGIGGISLGLESTGGFRTVAFCEIEAFPRAVLRKHWPEVVIHDDVRTLTASTLGGLRPDCIVGGFPCQDISVAGKGAGLSGARSGLWSEYARLVGELRPRWVVAENVGALRTRGVDRVCSDLEGEGYAVWPLLVGAWAVGAPHKRERVWIVAHRAGSRWNGGTEVRGQQSEEILTVSPAGRDGRGERPVGDTAGGSGEQARPVFWQQGGADDAGCSGPRWPARPGEPQHEWEEPRLAHFSGAGQLRAAQLEDGAEGQRGGRGSHPAVEGDVGCTEAGSPKLSLGGAVDGLPERLVRAAERRARRANREALKAYGNSVVPQVVAAIGRAILEVEGLKG